MATYNLKLSNKNTTESIQREFGRKFRFPNAYAPEIVVDGRKESLLPVIKADTSYLISMGIWGLLPDDFEGDWEEFQKIFSTLFIKPRSEADDKLNNVLGNDQPCLVIVSGFFVHRYMEKELQPYYVYQGNKEPFCLAGICTTLEDGFVTFSIYTVPSTGLIDSIQNLSAKMPLVIEKQDYDNWLSGNPSFFIEQRQFSSNTNLKAHPINRQFFNNEIYFESMLEPVSNSNLQK